jgi:hypothetical protein
MWLLSQTSCRASHTLVTFSFLPLSINVRIAIDEPVRILLAAITIFLVYLRVQLTGSVALLYTDRGSALKLTIREVTVSSESRLQRRERAPCE